MIKIKMTMIMLFSLIVLNNNLYAQNKQSLDGIKNFAQQFLMSKIKAPNTGKVDIKVGYLDARLQLAPCPDQQLEGFLPPNTRAEQTHIVGVRCQHAKPWSIYVPVRVEITRKVVTATRYLPRGKAITKEDLQLTPLNIQRLQRGYLIDQSKLLGQVTTTPIARGAIISPTLIRPANVVKRGQVIQITLKRNNLAINTKGVALTDGILGELIKVKSLSSNKILYAKVINRSQVFVD